MTIPNKTGEIETTNRITDISLRQAAIVAGFGYLIIFIFGTLANLSGIVVPADAAATADNIIASESPKIAIDEIK